jgi:hypothetical protein
MGNNDENEKKERELKAEDFFKAFYILLRTVGGAYSFPAELLDQIQDDEELITTEYIEEQDRFLFRLSKMPEKLPRLLRKEKKIWKPPSKKLFLPISRQGSG